MEGRVRRFAACSLLVPLGFPESHLTWRVCRAGSSTNGVGVPSEFDRSKTIPLVLRAGRLFQLLRIKRDDPNLLLPELSRARP
jgi:hypothetical protein